MEAVCRRVVKAENGDTHTLSHARMHTNTHIHTHTHIHTQSHTHSHAHTHKNIHTQVKKANASSSGRSCVMKRLHHDR
jgi:hypothetical protein